MRFPPVARVAAVAALVVTTLTTAGGVPRAVADSSPVAESFLQIVAHQDDDILFMNPDITREYSDPSVTVYLTGGEDKVDGFQDTCAYSASRDNGARAAHARMAGVSDPHWSRGPLQLSNGRTVEVDTLQEAPQVTLVFLRLHSSADPNFTSRAGGYGNLDDLYNVGVQESLTNSSLGSSLGASTPDGVCDSQYANQTYSRSDLVATLTALMTKFQPTVVLAQDPRVSYGYTRELTSLGDNSDHIGGARFAGEAALGYHRDTGHFLLRNYRDYNVRIDPSNVDPGTAGEKEQVFLAYTGTNRGNCPPPQSYCGTNDPAIDPTESAFYAMFPSRQYTRWSNGTAWTALDKGGLLNAFAVLDGHAQVWRENAGGSGWTGPTLIPGGDVLAPTLGVIKDANGLIHLFGIRLSDNQVVAVAQNSGGTWDSWQVLGNPNPDPVPNPNPFPGDAQLVGSPVPVLNDNGRLTVFVRNAGGGVSAVTQGDGGWPSTWADLGGYPVRDGLAAVLAGDGRIDLFAPAVNGIKHWRQNAPHGDFVEDGNVSGPAPAGAITVGKNADGRLEIFYEGGNAQPVTQYQQTDGTWTTTPDALATSVGMEGLAVATGGDGRITVVTRNRGGGVSLISQIAANRAFAASWSDLGNVIIGAPTVTLDGAGREVVLALGRDAALHVTRQSTAGTDSAFDPWQQAGS